MEPLLWTLLILSLRITGGTTNNDDDDDDVKPICYIHSTFGKNDDSGKLTSTNLKVEVDRDSGLNLKGTYEFSESAEAIAQRLRQFYEFWTSYADKYTYDAWEGQCKIATRNIVPLYNLHQLVIGGTMVYQIPQTTGSQTICAHLVLDPLVAPYFNLNGTVTFNIKPTVPTDVSTIQPSTTTYAMSNVTNETLSYNGLWTTSARNAHINDRPPTSSMCVTIQPSTTCYNVTVNIVARLTNTNATATNDTRFDYISTRDITSAILLKVNFTSPVKSSMCTNPRRVDKNVTHENENEWVSSLAAAKNKTFVLSKKKNFCQMKYTAITNSGRNLTKVVIDIASNATAFIKQKWPNTHCVSNVLFLLMLTPLVKAEKVSIIRVINSNPSAYRRYLNSNGTGIDQNRLAFVYCQKLDADRQKRAIMSEYVALTDAEMTCRTLHCGHAMYSHFGGQFDDSSSAHRRNRRSPPALVVQTYDLGPGGSANKVFDTAASRQALTTKQMVGRAVQQGAGGLGNIQMSDAARLDMLKGIKADLAQQGIGVGPASTKLRIRDAQMVQKQLGIFKDPALGSSLQVPSSSGMVHGAGGGTTYAALSPQHSPAGSAYGTPVGSAYGTPVGSRGGTPYGTPVGSRGGTPYGTPMGSRGNTPYGTPMGSPMGSPRSSPPGSPPGSPPTRRPAPPPPRAEVTYAKVDKTKFPSRTPTIKVDPPPALPPRAPPLPPRTPGANTPAYSPNKGGGSGLLQADARQRGARPHKPLPPTPARCRRSGGACAMRPRMQRGGSVLGGTPSGLPARGGGPPLQTNPIYESGGYSEIGLRRPMLNALDPDGDGRPGIGQVGLAPGGENSLMPAKTGGFKGMLGGDGGMGVGFMMMGAMMMSAQMQGANSRDLENIRMNKYDGMDKGLAVTMVVLEKLNDMASSMVQGGMMAAMAGQPHAGIIAMGTGIALQQVVGFVTMSIQIYQVLYPEDKPADPVFERYSQYNKLVMSEFTGERWCLAPEAKLNVIAQFFDKSVHRDDTEKTVLQWTATQETKIKILFHPMIMFNAELKITCAHGMLRWENFNSGATTMETQETDGTRSYLVHALAAMLVQKEEIYGRCGEMQRVIVIERSIIDLEDAMLLQKRGPGEPAGSEAMNSDICDWYPFKKFYVTVPTCNYDVEGTHAAFTTCGVLFRESAWNNANKTWMIVNPFGPKNGDRKVFTFGRRDFRAVMPIQPLDNSEHRVLCRNADQPSFCRLPEVFTLSDTTQCNNKVRFFRVDVSHVVDLSNEHIVQGYMLTCPPFSYAMHVIKQGQESNLKVVQIGGLGSVKKYMFRRPMPTVVWLFCQHSSFPGKKSDIIELTVASDTPMEEDVKPLKDQNGFNEIMFRGAMPQISQGGPMGLYYMNAYVTRTNLPDLLKTIREDKPVSLQDKNSEILQIDTAPGYLFSTSWDITEFRQHFDEEFNWLTYARKGCKTTSAVQITVSACRNARGELQTKPLGWWTWIWAEQQQDGTNTRTVATDTWQFVYRPSQTGIKVNGVLYQHLMKTCSVILQLPTSTLKIECKDTRITEAVLDGYDKICLAVSPARDRSNGKCSCGTRTNEWSEGGFDKLDYWMPITGEINSIRTGEESRTYGGSVPRYTTNFYWSMGSTPQVLSTVFCQDQGMYWSHYDATNKLTIFQYVRPLDFLVTRTPDYMAGSRIEPGDVVVTAAQQRMAITLRKKLSDLYDVHNDEKIIAINEFASGLTPDAKNITRIEVSDESVMAAKMARQNKIDQLQNELKEIEADLLADAIQGTIYYNNLEKRYQKQCCHLSVEPYNASMTKPKKFKLNVVDMDTENDFNWTCPDAMAFYKDNVVTPDGYVYGPSLDYERMKDIYRVQQRESWLVCMQTQSIIIEGEENIERFNEDLEEEMRAFVAENVSANALFTLEKAYILAQEHHDQKEYDWAAWGSDWYSDEYYQFHIDPESQSTEVVIDRAVNGVKIVYLAVCIIAIIIKISVLVVFLKKHGFRRLCRYWCFKLKMLISMPYYYLIYNEKKWLLWKTTRMQEQQAALHDTSNDTADDAVELLESMRPHHKVNNDYNDVDAIGCCASQPPSPSLLSRCSQRLRRSRRGGAIKSIKSIRAAKGATLQFAIHVVDDVNNINEGMNNIVLFI